MKNVWMTICAILRYEMYVDVYGKYQVMANGFNALLRLNIPIILQLSLSNYKHPNPWIQLMIRFSWHPIVEFNFKLWMELYFLV